MCPRIDLRIGLGDRAVRPDQVRDTARGPRIRVVARAVGEPDLPSRIAEQREGKAVLFGKGGVLLDGVETRAEDGAITGFEFADSITESAALGCSAGCVGGRIEPEKEVAPGIIVGRDVLAAMGGNSKCGCLLAFIQHSDSVTFQR